jgi:hypothetical protein
MTLRIELSEHETDLVLSVLLEEAAATRDRAWVEETTALAARIRDAARTLWPAFTTSAEVYRPGLLGLLEVTR